MTLTALRLLVLSSLVVTACGGPPVAGTPDGDEPLGGDAATGASLDAGTDPTTDASTVTGPPGEAPAAPMKLLTTGQGANSVSLAWTAAVAGQSPVDHYRVYRNGTAYDTTSGTTYTDAKATNVTTPGYGPAPYIPATVYRYAVSAVDSAGNEGPQQKSCTAWVYHAGIDSWTISTNHYDNGVTEDVNDKLGQPQTGSPTDIKVTVAGGSNTWQPFSGGPFLTTSPATWAMELGAFDYMIIDLKPTRAGQTWQLDIVSRITTGDNYNSGSVILGAGQFGPVSEVGKWATYKIPFLAASGKDGDSLQMGFGTFEGSISGGTLTVTKLLSGMNVQGSSFLTGQGMTTGGSSSTGTYLGGTQATSGGTGTYPVFPSQNVASTTITAQRTNMYKFGLQDPSGTAGNVYYVDNIGFTTE